jgi:hypothetical protein
LEDEFLQTMMDSNDIAFPHDFYWNW